MRPTVTPSPTQYKSQCEQLHGVSDYREFDQHQCTVQLQAQSCVENPTSVSLYHGLAALVQTGGAVLPRTGADMIRSSEQGHCTDRGANLAGDQFTGSS